MRPGHLSLLAEPAPVISPFLDPLEVDRGAPMARSNLGGRPCNGVPCAVHAGLLRGGDLLGSVVRWVGVPLVLLPSELLEGPRFEVGKRCDPGPGYLVGGLAS